MDSDFFEERTCPSQLLAENGDEENFGFLGVWVELISLGLVPGTDSHTLLNALNTWAAELAEAASDWLMPPKCEPTFFV
jgi:hypothetical protein